ncbi:MAG: NADP-specific glutamate dehydrogenase [Alphaproteobacteria bacterium]|nr:NADP-specific glutamate dehydrogenase [Alphaproteobacteria bacterium]
MEYLRRRTPPEPEFHQAVTQVLDHVISTANETDTLREHAIIERLTEPDRMIAFRVTWEDDNGDVQVNRGYRIQFNSAIGPYKGGLRFHPSVNPSVLKFLAFEQTFKNALTGLPMGGGKGGADFDPKGRSDREIMRFCAAFMVELHRHIGPDTDVPAGDINVGPREIGYLFGSYRRITNEFEGALTGKGLTYGGSELRVEATGFGLLHFVCHMLGRANDALDGKTVAVSGAGNVATHAAEKAIEMGAKVITLSDSKGFIHDPDGVDKDKIDWVRRLKSRPGASLAAYADEFGAEWLEDGKPWCVPCDVALPCATQNELGLSDARQLLDNGCRLIAEGANMPLTKKALELVHDSRILLGPGKAANAGGVAVSGLEITQNQMRASRTRGDISSELHDIMKAIHDKCAEAGDGKDGYIDYSRGADIAAFRKLAKAMLAQGIS